MKTTTATILIVVALVAGILIGRAWVSGLTMTNGGGKGAGKKTSDHVITAVKVDASCAVDKQQLVAVKKNGKVDWYVSDECAADNALTVLIDFRGADVGNCNCTDKLDPHGFAHLSLRVKDVADVETWPYDVYIGPAANPKSGKKLDPDLEIDP
jgi:hypothetical protein